MRSQATQTDQASSTPSFGKSLPHLASYDRDDDSVSPQAIVFHTLTIS